jgi:hypothetical protein
MQTQLALNRRVVILGGVSIFALSGMQIRAQQGEDTSKEDTAMTAILTFAQTNPYVAAAVAIYKFYSGLKEASAQRKALKAIRLELHAIQIKVDAILAVVSRLPEIIQRELNDQRKNELIEQIRVESETIRGVLVKYERAPGKPTLSQLDRGTLNDSALNAFKAAEELYHWGPDAFFALGHAYALLLTVKMMTGQQVQDVSHTQEKFSTRVEESRARFQEGFETNNATDLRYQTELSSVSGRFYLGTYWRSSGTGRFKIPIPRSVYFPVSGTPETSFKLGRFQMEPGFTNARRWTEIKDVPTWVSMNRNAYALFEFPKALVRKANADIKLMKSARVTAAECKVLESAAKLVRDSIRNNS